MTVVSSNACSFVNPLFISSSYNDLIRGTSLIAETNVYLFFGIFTYINSKKVRLRTNLYVNLSNFYYLLKYNKLKERPIWVSLCFRGVSFAPSTIYEFLRKSSKFNLKSQKIFDSISIFRTVVELEWEFRTKQHRNVVFYPHPKSGFWGC